MIDWNVPVFTSSYDKLLSDMAFPETKRENDVWIMSIHWGTEFIPYPNKEQVDLAHKLVDNGVDIVHGHHPHVFQPIEHYKNGLVMYSMGNFLFDENFAKETQKSYCLKASLIKNIPINCFLMKNKHYRPISICNIESSTVEIVPNKYWSSTKKRFTSKLYNTLRKLEYIPHIMDNDCYVYKSMKMRK